MVTLRNENVGTALSSGHLMLFDKYECMNLNQNVLLFLRRLLHVVTLTIHVTSSQKKFDRILDDHAGI